jgi:hypothetical protein
MNEILAIIYICFRDIKSDENKFINEKYLESDIFAAFSNMMEHLRDGFLYELGTEKVGIVNHMENYEKLMSYLEPDVLEIIKENELHH